MQRPRRRLTLLALLCLTDFPQLRCTVHCSREKVWRGLGGGTKRRESDLGDIGHSVRPGELIIDDISARMSGATICRGRDTHLTPSHLQIFKFFTIPPPSTSSPFRPSIVAIHLDSPSFTSENATCSTAIGSSSLSSRRLLRLEGATSRLKSTVEAVGSTNWSVDG